MSSGAISFHGTLDDKYKLSAPAATVCTEGFDFVDDYENFGSFTSGAVTWSYIYALGKHWVLFSSNTAPSTDMQVLVTDGVTTTTYTLESDGNRVLGGKLVTDGTTVWAAFLHLAEVPMPYQITYTDKCRDLINFSRNWCDPDTWTPWRLEVYASSGGAFAQIGRSEAKFSNSDGPGPEVGGVEGCALSGTAYFIWSEGGFTGTAHRLKASQGGLGTIGSPPCCASTCNCHTTGTPSPLALADLCRDGCDGNPPIDPSSSLPQPTDATVVPPYPPDVGDWNWVGERLVIVSCSSSAVTSEFEPIVLMQSFDTVNYGDTYTSGGQTFSPTAIIQGAPGILRGVSGGGPPVAFVIFPVSTDHNFSSGGQVGGSEVSMYDLPSWTLLQSLTGAETFPPPTKTADKPTALTVSIAPWFDPIDMTSVYYVGSRWLTTAAGSPGGVLSYHQMFRVVTDGTADFTPFDNDSALVDDGLLTPFVGSVLPETWNTWETNLSASWEHFERRCIHSWISESSGSGSERPFTPEAMLLGDWIYYGRVAAPSPSLGVGRSHICRQCEPCDTTSVLLTKNIIDGTHYTQGQAPIDWTATRCPAGMTRVDFLVDGVVVCTATHPVGNLFYYCDTAPGTFDVGALALGSHTLEVDGYTTGGTFLALDSETIVIDPSGAGCGTTCTSFGAKALQIVDSTGCNGVTWSSGTDYGVFRFETCIRFDTTELTTGNVITSYVAIVGNQLGYAFPNEIDGIFGWESSPGVWQWWTDFGGSPQGSIAPDTWYHLVWTIDPTGNAVVEVDGVTLFSYAAAPLIPGGTTGYTLAIGVFPNNNGGHLFYDNPCVSIDGTTEFFTDFEDNSIVPPFSTADGGCATLVTPP